MQIFQSATKLVLIIMTLALVVGLFLGKIEPKDFVVLTSVVYAFYFGQKQSVSPKVV